MSQLSEILGNTGERERARERRERAFSRQRREVELMERKTPADRKKAKQARCLQKALAPPEVNPGEAIWGLIKGTECLVKLEAGDDGGDRAGYRGHGGVGVPAGADTMEIGGNVRNGVATDEPARDDE